MFPRLFFVLLFWFGTLAAGSVHALEHCVSSASELKARLALLQFTPGNHTVKLVQGAYDLRPGGLRYTPSHSGSLSLLGGYGPNCSSREVDPTNTRLDGYDQYDTQVDLTLPGGGLLEGLQFLRLQSPTNTGAVNLARGGEDPRTLVFRHNVINSTSGGPTLYLSWVGELRFENNVVRQNSGKNPSAAAGIAMSVQTFSHGDYPARLVVAHNTISANAGPISLAAAGGPSPMVAFQNNIIWGNTGSNLYLHPSNFLLSDRNVLGSISGGGSLALGSTWSSANPQFVAPAQGDFRLSATSPAVNYGSNAVAGGLWARDLDGNPRLIGSRPDAGAYESAVDDSAEQIVTSQLDAGPGTLRQAILNANTNPGPTTIRFAIPGTCPRGIVLQSPLPDIVGNLFMDGTSQAASVSNSDPEIFNGRICVFLRGADGSTLTSLPHVLRVAAGSNARLHVRGLAFGRLPNNAVLLQGGRHHLIEGSQFGGTIAGGYYDLGSMGNRGVSVGSGDTATIIGGSGPAGRNVFSAGYFGIEFTHASSGLIRNNLIGLAPNGTAATGFSRGIQLGSTTGIVVRENFVSSNHVGINIEGPSDGNVVISNRIGGCPCGEPGVVGNVYGVLLGGLAYNNRIGDLYSGGNEIAYNSRAGVRLLFAHRGNEISGNAIYFNDLSGFGDPAIDLGDSGPTLNDPGDQDDGPNGLQNHPVLTLVERSGSRIRVEGTLDAQPDSYIIEFYSSHGPVGSSGRGELMHRIGYLPLHVTDGVVAFSVELPTFDLLGDQIAAVTIRSNGDTSEPSAPVAITKATDVLFADGFEL